MKKQKSIVELKKTLTRLFNKFIRLRDTKGESVKCISCSNILRYGGSNLHAGHYVPAGASSPLRWDEMNVNAQCAACNTFRNGNPHEYRLGMINKYGEVAERELWGRRHDKSFYPKREWLTEKIEYYRNQIKLMENK